jgi:drug/metabolite transporter (DMT)-like permease
VVEILNSQSLLVISAVVILWIIWGSNAWATKIAIATIPPLIMSGICFLIAGVVFLVWSFFRYGRKQILDLQDWKTALIIGIIMLLGGQGARAWGEQFLSSGTTSLLFATVPLWIVIVAGIYFKDNIGKNIMLWIGVGLVGVMLLILSLMESGVPSFRAGLFLTAGAFLWAVGSLFMRKTNHSQLSTISSIGKQMLLGGILLTIAGIVIGELGSLNPAKISFQSFMGMMYMITIGSLLGFPVFVWLLQKTSELVANSFAFISPIVAIIIGWTFLDESFGIQIILGGFILLGSVMMIMLQSKVKGNLPLKRLGNKDFLGD